MLTIYKSGYRQKHTTV